MFPRSQSLGGPISAKIKVTQNDTSIELENLYLLDFILANVGNKDLDEFRCGLTLIDGAQVIAVEATPGDRHHKIHFEPPEISPSAPSLVVDFTLKPFNRGDIYQSKLYVTEGFIYDAAEFNEALNTLIPTSPQPVRFTRLPSAGELLTKGGSMIAQIIMGVAGISINRSKIHKSQ